MKWSKLAHIVASTVTKLPGNGNYRNFHNVNKNMETGTDESLLYPVEYSENRYCLPKTRRK